MIAYHTTLTARTAGQIRLSEERYALAAAASNDGLYDWDLRTDLIYYSAGWKALLGLAEEEVGNSPSEWLDRVHCEDLIWLHATLDAQASAGGRPFQIEYRIRHANGGWRWMLCRGIAVLDAEGEPQRIVGSQIDITDRKVAEEGLRLSEERYALAAAGSNDGLWDWRVPEGEVYYSARWARMLGLGEREMTGTIEDWYARVHPDCLPGLRAAMDLHLSGGSRQLEHEFRMLHASGAECWMLVRGAAMRDDNGTALRMAGSMSDITARKHAEEQLLFDAFHDGLTGLSNRHLLLDRIGQAIDRRRHPTDAQFALILFDLDQFKAINDSLGTALGDEVLRIVARRLGDARRSGDTVARTSVDEFGVLMDGVADVKAAMSAAERLAAAVCRPITLPDGREIVLTCSAGLAMSNTGYAAATDMLRDASLAMFRAKAAGRSRIEVFDDALRERALSRLRTESDLRVALDSDQLFLAYQPIIRMQDGSIAGFEALVRWSHPERGTILPGEFIALAEETGLILRLGRWALKEAALQIKDWRQRTGRDLFVSVNVSGRQLMDDDMAAAVAQVLEETGVEPRALKLEITESLLLDDTARCVQMLHDIRKLGVRLCLDDFGTGFSNLSYLHSYPVDTLKIDRSFVRAATDGDRRAEIARIITMLAAALDLEVVAEGVERDAEAAFLRGLHCEYAQGYFFARPMPPEEAERHLLVQAA
ncbi:putative bifunctional diguanylate cyclase/phosphodiesterase [Rhodocista pekingensis]|uniref:Bifunctional diguanylate cyclase/phosphodiesterase n=1 Tax=Rhodocista pekingensis TaxID=201185 RepID=A0ABW2KUF2_9PROT